MQYLFALISRMALIATGILMPLLAATYEVGPGKQYTTIGSAPWTTLEPGDTVLIYWKSTPYKEKWVICRKGTAKAPIVIRGVENADGQRPVIDGNGATTSASLSYWNQERSVIKVGGANKPADTTPEYITIENLEIKNARQPYTFKAHDGGTRSYTRGASAIYVEKGRNITIRRCVMYENGNGLVVASSDTTATYDVTVDGNYFHTNGNPGSSKEHNTYSAAIGITFKYNRYGPLRAGSIGSALKDRSSGLVVRHNWIEGGNRQLELVDGEDSAIIRKDPLYRQAIVYGNILIEPTDEGNRQVVHYGGDSGVLANYRKGTLHFYNNTVISKRKVYTTVLFSMSTNDERIDARNNLFYMAASDGSRMKLVEEFGQLDMSRNWIKSGWGVTNATFRGTLRNNGMVEGTSPAWVDEAGGDYHLTSGSTAVDAGGVLNTTISGLLDFVLPFDMSGVEYKEHQRFQSRPVRGLLDIGAFEYQDLKAK